MATSRLVYGEPISLHNHNSTVGPAGKFLHVQSYHAALRFQRQALFGVFLCHHNDCSSKFPGKCTPSNFFIITETQHVFMAASISPWKPEAQSYRGSASKGLSYFIIHFFLRTCYLCSPWNSILPLFIVSYY